MRLETLKLITARGAHVIDVEVTETPAEKAQGLMFRTRLADTSGMLFFYETPQEITMWMRNTYIPLDMVFIRADGIVHRIEARTEPLSENIIASRGDVTACLELAGGAAERLGLKPGDRVEHRFFKPGREIAARCGALPECCRRRTLASSERALHPAHHRLALEAGDDLREVVEVPYLELDQHLREVVRPAQHAHVVDVAVGLADHLRDLRQRARLVERGDDDLGRKPLGIVGVDVPGHVDPALVLELLELGRMDLEDADALAVRHHADDTVAGHRPALLELDGHVVLEAANGQHLRLLGFAAAAAPASGT